MAHYGYTFKRIAKQWRSKNVITSMEFEFNGVLFSFFRLFFRCQIYLFIFSVDYWFLLLTFLFVYLILKMMKRKSKKTMKYSDKSEFIKERWGFPLLKLWSSSWDPTFKFRRGSWGPTFNLWGVSRVLGARIPRSWGLGSWSHFSTIPIWWRWTKGFVSQSAVSNFPVFVHFTLEEKVQLKNTVRQLLLIVVKGLEYVN